MTMAHYTFALLATALLSASAAQAQGLYSVQASQSFNCTDGNITRMDAVTSAMIAGNGARARQLLDQLYPGDHQWHSGSSWEDISHVHIFVKWCCMLPSVADARLGPLQEEMDSTKYSPMPPTSALLWARPNTPM